MKTKPFFLVIDSATRTVKRSRTSWPQLEPGEIIVRLALEIPEALLPHINDIVLDDVDAVGIAAEPVAL